MVNLFKKAKLIYESSLILKSGTGRQGQYFDVQDPESLKWHNVTIKTDEKGTIIQSDCDCKHQSLKSQYTTICSHIICVIIYEYFHTKKNKGDN